MYWKNIRPPGGWYHVARVRFIPEMSSRPTHCHDFAEVFWVEEGSGVHRVNGQRRALEQGDCVLIRPEDRHSFHTQAATGLVFVNVAFPAQVLEQLRRRYYPKQRWPWRGAALPACRRLTNPQRLALSRWADAASMEKQRRIELDAMVLELLLMVDRAQKRAVKAHRHAKTAGEPAWLEQAANQFGDPRQMQRGLEGFWALTGRCPEHVNRVVRKFRARTATDLINDIRMDFAARKLRMTDQPIIEIANSCGVPNLGYFYRLFQARLGTTPRTCRLQAQAPVR